MPSLLGRPLPADQPVDQETIGVFKAPNYHHHSVVEIRDAEIPISMLAAFKMGLHWNERTFGYRKPFLTYQQSPVRTHTILESNSTDIAELLNLPSDLTSIRLSLLLRAVREQEAKIAHDEMREQVRTALAPLLGLD